MTSRLKRLNPFKLSYLFRVLIALATIAGAVLLTTGTLGLLAALYGMFPFTFVAQLPIPYVGVYTASVDYSAQRRHLGWNMVTHLLEKGLLAGCTGLRFGCASSNESNEFWRLIGFHCTNVTRGGVKRGRDINHWRADIQPTLFTLPSMQPSDKAIHQSSWVRMRRDGLVMPSRWSRGHYVGMRVLESKHE